MKIEKILVAIDGSDESLDPLDAGIRLTKANAAALVVVCVASLDSFPDDLRGIAADEVARDLTCSCLVFRSRLTGHA
ncbi:MAG: universal stress protein [Gammaproteobacteria bacterium]|nr:universal stress protein [Gammaproteobacteria bacterium]